MAAQIGAMQHPHLDATKGQVVQLGGIAPGGMQSRPPTMDRRHAELRQAQRSRKTGQLRDPGRKHRAGRRAGYL